MATKQATLTDKKKPAGNITPQKKEKSSKHVKIDKPVKDSHTRVVSQSKMRNYLYHLAITLMATGFSCIHMHHVSTMFENDRHFSHLSNLEREMTFRTEMGLYYSYYKTLIEAPTFGDGMIEILNDNITEYPSVINTLKRFNLYPEVIISAAYRMFIGVMDWLHIPSKQCWQVERGGGLLPVLSCEGLGDPMYFYLEAVWICAGLTAAFIFIYGLMLSGCVAGGLISILCFFYNHSESTRVQWTPPLRESFAYPFCLFQMLSITVMLKNGCSSWKQGVMVALSTVCCLVTWQFSQFVLATQIIAVLILFLFDYIKKHSLLFILLVQTAAVQHGLLLLMFNELLASSVLVSLLAASLIVVLVLEPMVRGLPTIPRAILLLTLVGLTTLAIRSRLAVAFGSKDDAHIMNLLRSKLSTYKDFHTLLYTCSAEFDFMPTSTLRKLSETLLLPSVGVVFLAIALHGLGQLCKPALATPPAKQGTKPDKNKQVASSGMEPELAYNLLQLVAFAVMAGLIMRLKLFLTPHLCIIASLLASRKYFRIIRSIEVHWAILVVIVSGMTVKGIQNINEQRNVMGEYSNVPFEQLLEWVKTETNPDSVFAGPMPVMANLLLSTRRPIVNHPHYEDAGMRERTKKVYSVFSRKSPQEVYKILSEMHVQFVILEESWCFRESRPGCGMTDLWDVEEPENKHKPSVCPQLFLQNPAPFERVFSNNDYVVLWLHSQYVELKPMKEYKL